MKYLFGPVNSRRLGLSQGIDLLTTKTCNFDCIYCEVGGTMIHTCERREYTPTEDILAEIDELLAHDDLAKPIDVFTITAMGEPTLHTGLGRIIRHIKEKTGKPVAVLTNGATLYRADVRQELLAADIVIPSLDSARPASFRKIDRPAQCVDLEEIIAGLILFCQEFTGQVWLEVMLAKNINDQPRDIEALREAIMRIKPHRVQLNTVVRPPLESFAKPLSHEDLSHIAAQLPGNVEIIANFAKREHDSWRSPEPGEILEMLQRRPCTASDISEALNLEPVQTNRLMEELADQGRVLKMLHQGKIYYQPPHTQ
jgi:wyosine [tRNA(Phe)-imidazoG37] synthetase (radical SAM superfamily)